MSLKEEKYGIGVIVPVITPLKKDGRIDHKGLERIIKHGITGGVHGIFVLGTTGEGPCFTGKERGEIIKTARKVTGEDIPLYAGVMDTSARRVMENISIAQDAGADVVVVTPPYYLSSGSQDEIVRHMELSAQYAKVPVIAYNIPQCTHVNIELPTVRKILEIDNIIGLKDSSGDWEQFQKEIFLKSEMDFKLQMGAEDLAGIALLMGADGCVSGVGNYEPRLIVRMYNEAKQGNVDKVKELQHKAAELRRAFTSSNFWLAGLKYICSVLGFCEEYVSDPFPQLTEEQKEKVIAILKEEDIKGIF
ncbi:MAG: dihydrodipicolinate synthase family protein [Caldiserica bacterium]|nr:dihydrodipicolinate synthase family protein [Caldisericota bacterium]